MGQNDAVLADVKNFMRSRVILTAAELNIFTRLHENPVTAKKLAERMGTDARATTRILDCLVTFGLLKKQEENYRLTEQGLFLSSRHPETVLPMVLHMNHLWDSWSYLTDAIKTGANPHLKPVTGQDEEIRKAFIEAMYVVGRFLSREIADAYDASRFKRLLDVGGASGAYTIAFLEKNLQMKAVLFDLESVILLTEKKLKTEGLSSRVELVAGDYYKDELPKGCDLALLSAIIHQNSPEENLDLYRKIYRALEPGGAVLIRDHIMDELRTKPSDGALFALNMLLNTPGGDTYTFKEVKADLEKAGFVDVQWLKAGEQMDCLVEAKKTG